MVGQILGNYRVLSELSRGGMGAVYRAQHALLGRSAAIKFLRPELSTDDDLVQRFFDEARAASAIRHPGIIEVYDFGYTPEGDAYYVMELLAGESLAARLRKRGKLGELEVAAITRDIASALTAAHEAGIVHRDLKPDNIFLVPGEDGGERVKVLDFGVAKLSDRSTHGHTQTGVLMGTPLYMAPEQAREAARTDHRADLYSLGCIMYEMLVGAPPFTGEGAGEIIAMQMFTPPEAPRSHLPTLSPELDALVLRMLAKEPNKRPETATEVFRTVAGFGSRLSARSAELSKSERPSLPPTPRPSRSALNLGLLDTPPPEQEVRGSLGMIAGLVTVALAGVVAMILLFRGDDAPVKRAPAPAPHATTPAPPAPPAPTSVPAPVATQPPPAQASKPVIEPAHATEIPRPTRPSVTKTRPQPEGGPVVRPGTHAEGTITSATPQPAGPVTTKGSPIETSLEP